MTLPLPSSLSPSKIASFTSCALAFRFSAIDRLPEPPSPAASKGTLVHRALELLLWHCPPGERTPGAAQAFLQQAWGELQDDPDIAGLNLAGAEADAFLADASVLVDNYFRLEDPNQVRAVGFELMLSARLGSLHLRGIIDRLDLDDDGELVVTDYKTGRAPSERYEGRQLNGVSFYAFLCEQVLGRRPARVQLLHLREPTAIVSVPTEQSLRGLKQRSAAVWTAVERACLTEDFRPKPGPLCGFCSFKSYCPAFGGDPDAARLLPATAG